MKPLRVRRTQGVLLLTLDTPGSPVNIFDVPAARQVVEAMEQAERDGTRAVVFQSAKPDSFLNGARLMSLYSAGKSPHTSQDLGLLSAAYEAVRNSRVLTVAAIRGNCYGCGLEFALTCKARVAADTRDTHFYLTELKDYLLLPAFGSMRALPPAGRLARRGGPAHRRPEVVRAAGL